MQRKKFFTFINKKNIFDNSGRLRMTWEYQEADKEKFFPTEEDYRAYVQRMINQAIRKVKDVEGVYGVYSEESGLCVILSNKFEEAVVLVILGNNPFPYFDGDLDLLKLKIEDAVLEDYDMKNSDNFLEKEWVSIEGLVDYKMSKGKSLGSNLKVVVVD